MVPIDVTIDNGKRNAHREFEFRVETDDKKSRSKRMEDEDEGRQE